MKKSYMQGILIWSLHARVVVYKMLMLLLKGSLRNLQNCNALKKTHFIRIVFVLGL